MHSRRSRCSRASKRKQASDDESRGAGKIKSNPFKGPSFENTEEKLREKTGELNASKMHNVDDLKKMNTGEPSSP